MPEIEMVSISCTYCMGNPAPWGDMGPMCPTCGGSGIFTIQRRYECEECGWVDFTKEHECFGDNCACNNKGTGHYAAGHDDDCRR
jgi:hypothetical protein